MEKILFSALIVGGLAVTQAKADVVFRGRVGAYGHHFQGYPAHGYYHHHPHFSVGLYAPYYYPPVVAYQPPIVYAPPVAAPPVPYYGYGNGFPRYGCGPRGYYGGIYGGG